MDNSNSTEIHNLEWHHTKRFDAISVMDTLLLPMLKHDHLRAQICHFRKGSELFSGHHTTEQHLTGVELFRNFQFIPPNDNKPYQCECRFSRWNKHILMNILAFIRNTECDIQRAKGKEMQMSTLSIDKNNIDWKRNESLTSCTSSENQQQQQQQPEEKNWMERRCDLILTMEIHSTFKYHNSRMRIMCIHLDMSNHYNHHSPFLYLYASPTHLRKSTGPTSHLIIFEMWIRDNESLIE